MQDNNKNLNCTIWSHKKLIFLSCCNDIYTTNKHTTPQTHYKHESFIRVNMDIRTTTNLFTSLPSDIIRYICEFDATYRTVYSTQLFRTELLHRTWICSHVTNVCEYFIRLKMREYLNTFRTWKTDWGEVYIRNGKCYDAKTWEEIDFERDTYFIWSVYGKFLRWKMRNIQTVTTTTTIQHKKDEKWKKALEPNMEMMYDGFCGSMQTIPFTVKDIRHMLWSKGCTPGIIRMYSLVQELQAQGMDVMVDHIWL